ncbi:MAG: beta-N-acetylhexosaminidase [Oscillospiraceae bacterium]|jgi:hypothetical protein|nr:beta-N-acetylhexosaminidase [Oscillospiraceae bacterium]
MGKSENQCDNKCDNIRNEIDGRSDSATILFPEETVRRVRSRVFSQVRCAFSGEIEAGVGKGLFVEYADGRAKITAQEISSLARGFFLLAMALREGRAEISIRQEKCFKDVGPYVDMSRGGVMHVPALKRYVDQVAALGMNVLMLYTEETYTIPEQPYFGYLRGRYSPDELREIDAYAASMGVELIPSIQTLAHLGQFLQWMPVDHLKDTNTCLMIDEPETYELIESMLRALRACFSSRRIHIGMDEAHGVGLARYFEKHGLVDRFELLNRHVGRVVDICKKYEFEPMMWSDMYFRLGSKTGEYYDLESNIPQSVINSLPDVAMVYWDYYHTDAAVYDFMISAHEQMGRPVVFAGGVWTWSGFLPHVALTRETMNAALGVCAAHKVSTVLATQWGDDATETNYFLASNQLALFSEYCWRGADCSDEDVANVGAFLTGLSDACFEAFGAFYEGAIDRRTGKGLIYGDLLYPLISEKSDLNERIEAYENARKILQTQKERPDCRYADYLFELAAGKARAIQDIRRLYEAGDKDGLRIIAEGRIPELIRTTRLLRDAHRCQWESTFKRNGWEELALRYGAIIGRMEDVADALKRYAAGELSTLAELDEKPLPVARKLGMQFYNVYVTPQY